MTLHEIEETLHKLQSRHPGLNEALLVTLLRGGGWEEKNIQEALFLFRSGGVEKGKESPTMEAEALPPLQMDPVLMPQADEKHMLEEHYEEIAPPPEKMPEKVFEPQSLIENLPEKASSKKDELPHNLPLRPFETSEHIWPFARYKDVFYGDLEPETPAKEANEAVILQQRIEKRESILSAEELRPEPLPPTPPPVEQQKPVVVMVEPADIPTQVIVPGTVQERPTAPASPAKGDEKLVITACIMLLAVLLLLGYMYSNGRL